jgi:predicted nucleic acid-binding protein
MAWVLHDEASSYAEAALSHIVCEGGIVPELWWLETRNVLLMAERRNRLTREDADTADAALRDLGLVQDTAMDRAQVLRLARSHSLTSYDATYLELALRHEAPIATLDNRLAEVAKQEKLLWKNTN